MSRLCGIILGTVLSSSVLSGSETLAWVKPGEKTSIDMLVEQCQLKPGRSHAQFKECIMDRCSYAPAPSVHSCHYHCGVNNCSNPDQISRGKSPGLMLN